MHYGRHGANSVCFTCTEFLFLEVMLLLIRKKKIIRSSVCRQPVEMISTPASLTILALLYFYFKMQLKDSLCILYWFGGRCSFVFTHGFILLGCVEVISRKNATFTCNMQWENLPFPFSWFSIDICHLLGNLFVNCRDLNNFLVIGFLF